MSHNSQLTRRLLLCGVVAGCCIVTALVMGKARFKTTASVSATVSALDYDATGLAALLQQPNAMRTDIARMNLLAGSGLGWGEELALTNLVRELDAMTARVKAETARHFARFQRAPEEFKGSEAYFKMLCLVTVLQQGWRA